MVRIPPGPETRSPLGSLFPFARDPLGFLIRLHASYGDLAHFKIRRRDVYLVSRPDEIEGILVTHAGNFVKSRYKPFSPVSEYSYSSNLC